MQDTQLSLLDTGEALRDHFLGWQCKIRQLSVRQSLGRPSAAMRPRATLEDGTVVAEAVTVLIVHRDPGADADMFRHVVRRTQDPRLRHEAAIKMLSSVYYQYPREFSDVLTALFAVDSPIAEALYAAGRCRLTFDQFSQFYRLPCRIAEQDRETPAWRATYWHNHAFNPTLPGSVRILAFTPDWNAAEADPDPRRP